MVVDIIIFYLITILVGLLLGVIAELIIKMTMKEFEYLIIKTDSKVLLENVRNHLSKTKWKLYNLFLYIFLSYFIVIKTIYIPLERTNLYASFLISLLVGYFTAEIIFRLAGKGKIKSEKKIWGMDLL